MPELVGKARAASSMKANPLPLTDEELAEIALGVAVSQLVGREPHR